MNLFRIEPCESFGKYVLEIHINDTWVNFYTGYEAQVRKMGDMLSILLNSSRGYDTGGHDLEADRTIVELEADLFAWKKRALAAEHELRMIQNKE